jgi:hypothetical protein
VTDPHRRITDRVALAERRTSDDRVPFSHSVEEARVQLKIGDVQTSSKFYLICLISLLKQKHLPFSTGEDINIVSEYLDTDEN